MSARSKSDYDRLEQLETVRRLRDMEATATRDDLERLKEEFWLQQPVLTEDAMMTLQRLLMDRLSPQRAVKLTAECRLQADDDDEEDDGDGEVQTDAERSWRSDELDNQRSTSGDQTVPERVLETESSQIKVEPDGDPDNRQPTSAGYGQPTKEVSMENFNLRMERTMTFLTEVCDAQSEPGDAVCQHDTQTRPLRSARPFFDRRIHQLPEDLDVEDDQLSTSPRQRADETLQYITDAASEQRTLRAGMKASTIYKRAALSSRQLQSDLVLENPVYRDWETSERSLRYLEQRIAEFVAAQSTYRSSRVAEAGSTGTGGHGHHRAALPKLRRYEHTDESPKFPSRGGRVVVRRSDCEVAKRGAVSNSHEHIRLHVVDQLPDYRRLRHSKMVLYQLLDDARDRYVQTQAQ